MGGTGGQGEAVVTSDCCEERLWSSQSMIDQVRARGMREAGAGSAMVPGRAE